MLYKQNVLRRELVELMKKAEELEQEGLRYGQERETFRLNKELDNKNTHSSAYHFHVDRYDEREWDGNRKRNRVWSRMEDEKEVGSVDDSDSLPKGLLLGSLSSCITERDVMDAWDLRGLVSTVSFIFAALFLEG